jgi:hypothetical protein
VSSNDDLAAAIESNRDEILTNRETIPGKVREYADLGAVYHGLRYFLLAAIISFLTLVLISGFALNQAYRASEIPEVNTHIICQALVSAELPPPEECTPKVLKDHTDHEEEEKEND